MTFRLPKTTVFIDADIELLREHGARTFKAEMAASFVKQYDERGTLSDKQWEVVASMVKSLKTPAQAPALSPDLEILAQYGHLALCGNANTAKSFVERARQGYHFSDKQVAFIKIIADQLREQVGRIQARGDTPVTPEQLKALLADQIEKDRKPTVSTTVVALFDAAAATGLQVPHIKARHFYAYRATQASKNPGSVTILAQRGGAYYGSIMRDGTLRLGRDCPPAAVEQIKAFAADPITSSVVEGRTTGACCFCGTKLTTDASQTMGYGPDCAGRYGLPWGQTVVKHNVAVQAEELMK